LPEAQLDRFLFELQIDYPSVEDECTLVEKHSFTPLERLEPVLSCQDVMQMRTAVASLPAAPNVIQFAVKLARATRPSDAAAPDYIKKWIRWGASPRASQNLILAARARAACEGRFHVSCADVSAIAPLVLRHRLIRSFQADADGQSSADIVQRLLTDLAPK
jgi:MoxR-like ATPase